MDSVTTARGQVTEVGTRLRRVVTESGGPPEFCVLLERLLAQPGRVLAPGGAPKWPAFVVDTCLALGGALDPALDAAVAVELVVAAIDVVDDVVDGEWEGEPGEWRRALNASLAMTGLAHAVAGRLADAIGMARAQRVARLLADGAVACCAGQDLDLRLEQELQVSEDEAHEMTRRKSGSLVSMACRVGAAVATDDGGAIELAGVFGEHAGVVAQLLNDLAGVELGSTRRGTDLQRRKKTLPVAFALRCARDEGLPEVLAWYTGGPTADGDEERLAQTLRRLGALHYTWLVADIHRREALAVVRRLGEVTGRKEVSRLRRLVPVLRARRAGRSTGEETTHALGRASVDRGDGSRRPADRSGAVQS
jgi:geranylgeranyl diphosphate synthase type I